MQAHDVRPGGLMAGLLAALFLSASAPHACSKDMSGATNSPGVLEYLSERAGRMVAKLPAVPAERLEWERRRERVRQDLAKALGLPNRLPMKAAVERTSEKDGLLTEDVCYLWDERAYVAANVVRPKDGLGPLPAIVIPPGWTGELTQDFYKTFVYHMARKGYLILFITDPHVGKRKTGNLELYALGSVAGTQAMGVQVFDTLRGLDYLLTRRDVDPGRIGIAGLCQGAEQTWLAAALEERFKVAAPVCGTTTYESWAQMPHFLRVDLSDASPYVAGILQHTDWHEIGACISPRPVLLASNSGDNWWPRAGFDKVVLTLKQIYALEGAPDRFEVVCDLRSHSMTPFIPELDPWFEQHLKPAPASPASPLPCEKPEDLDFDMSHYFQRRIARQTSSLPKQFDSLQTWRTYRDGIGQWLASACAVDELRRGQPKANGSRSQQGIRTESVELPQDDNFYCPATVFSREPAQTPRAAVVLSHASAACVKDASVNHTARALAEAGFVVIVPEHASANPASERFLLLKHGFLISLYGAADTVGLPPLAMRVWDDLSCVEYLSRRVKGARILLAGTDIGGLDAVLAAALDRRVAGVVSVGAITVQDWAEKVAPNLKAFNTIVPCLPSLTEKTDWQFFYAALAPRPLLLVPSNDRKNWPNSAFRQVSDTCRSLYDLAGAGQGFTVAQREDCTEALANRAQSPEQKLLATVAKELVAQASEETHQRRAESEGRNMKAEK